MKGFIKLHRDIVNSDIYQMPPLYLRVFERLLLEANHEDAYIPYRKKGENIIGKKLIKRGERLTSIRDIAEWVGWYERRKFKVPNPKTITSILDWLIKNEMLAIVDYGNRKETHYNIVNYSVYQGRESYESNAKVTVGKQLGNTQVTVGKQLTDINKNVKNDKNVKNKRIKPIEISEIEIESLVKNYTTNIELQKAIKDFISHRQNIKKALTTKTLTLTLKKLSMMEKSEELRIEILNESIMNSWQGIFPLKTNNQVQNNKPAQVGNFEQRAYDNKFYDDLYVNK